MNPLPRCSFVYAVNFYMDLSRIIIREQADKPHLVFCLRSCWLFIISRAI